MTKNYIVVTSIFPPTEAIKKLSQIEGWQLIVVGDRKSPKDWICPNVRYLSLEAQRQYKYKIGELLPIDHYCRKMMGYLNAIKSGADYILDTDDDNIPKDNWKIPNDLQSCSLSAVENLGFVNVYRYFTDHWIWPRGFPLELILKPESVLSESQISRKALRIGVWQGLADLDPDVDAIYRLTNNQPCYFEQREAVALARNTLCPFNSQNTIICQALFPLLYLPAFVSFRFTDILRGLVAQPIMWAAGYHLAFTSATVNQERNFHNYFQDFQDEIPCYLYAQKIIEIVSETVRDSRSISENLLYCYQKLSQYGIVEERELELLAVWLSDLQDINMK